MKFDKLVKRLLVWKCICEKRHFAGDQLPEKEKLRYKKSL
jgi:hypothetical protein